MWLLHFCFAQHTELFKTTEQLFLSYETFATPSKD